jgi:two-component system, NtrC family, response regulator HydG
MEGRKIKVLVVDDEKIIRDFFKRLLSLMDLEVVTAEDGYKALELVKENSYDLYFIDVRMPGMNGLDTYREIRKIHPEAVVMMMTGYAVEDLLKQAQDEGAHGPIRKPFDIAQVKDVLDKVAKDGMRESLTVLVIDDEEVILEFFSAFLKNKNIKYKVSRSKREALEAVKNEKFSLIFLDLLLKDENGVDVYQGIKAIQPHAHIVLMTGFPQKAKEIAGQIELAGCLYKPFEVDGILKYIEEAKANAK